MAVMDEHRLEAVRDEFWCCSCGFMGEDAAWAEHKSQHKVVIPRISGPLPPSSLAPSPQDAPNPGVGGTRCMAAKHEQVTPHECPYRAEINDDYEMCTCCDWCRGECADDI